MSAADDMVRNGTRIVNGRLDRVGRAVGIELLGRLIRATPIDNGRARGNWNASVGVEDGSDDPERREREAFSEGSARIAQLKLSTGAHLFVSNGVPYMGRLNDGYSQQAPAAFIQGTVQDMRSFVNQSARRENLRG